MKLKSIIQFFNPSRQAWIGASLGAIMAGLVIWASSALNLFKHDHVWDISIYFFIGILISLVSFGIILLVITLFMKLPRLYKWSAGCSGILMYLAFLSFGSNETMIIFYLTIIAFASLLVGSLWSFFSNHSRMSFFLTLTLFLIGFAGSISIGGWLLYNQPSFDPPEVAFEQKNSLPIELPDPSQPGPYEVEKLTYGSGKDLNRSEYGKEVTMVTNSVDGSSFLVGWDGWNGWLRSWYWGFDAKELPLNGRVWYPKGEGSFPLVLIVHGNHEMGEYSDTGYEYLGNLFASQGFITVSIDENFLNSSWFDLGDLVEGTARGWLILEHLQLWKVWNDIPENPFYHRVNRQKIGLIGHSRGGEAIAIAAALNPLKYYPDNANIHFDYGFNITSLAAIAPVDGHYSPGGLKINLNNINYFVMHGSQDGDVRSFEGSGQYQRVKFVDDPDYNFKSALYIFGANHGQFNENWGLRDTSWPTSALYALGRIMPEKDQQKIAKVYLTAFLRSTLKGEAGYIPLFRNFQAGEKWLPKTLYLSQFDDSTSKFIISGKEHLDITKISLKGGSQIGEDLETWRQGKIRLKRGTVLETGIFLGWNTCVKPGKPSYTITLPENKMSIEQDSVLMISLADGDGEDDFSILEDNALSGDCEKEAPIDFTIELTDFNGERARLPLSRFSLLQPQIKADIMKSTFFEQVRESEIIFQTFEFPIREFTDMNPRFDPSRLHTIRFIFDLDPSGLIVMDRLGFRKDIPSKPIK